VLSAPCLLPVAAKAHFWQNLPSQSWSPCTQVSECFEALLGCF
jgi:hypothetical protein